MRNYTNELIIDGLYNLRLETIRCKAMLFNIDDINNEESVFIGDVILKRNSDDIEYKTNTIEILDLFKNEINTTYKTSGKTNTIVSVSREVIPNYYKCTLYDFQKEYLKDTSKDVQINFNKVKISADMSISFAYGEESVTTGSIVPLVSQYESGETGQMVIINLLDN